MMTHAPDHLIPSRRRLPLHLFVTVGCIFLTVCGCGRNDRGVIPVRGVITLDGGSWPKQGGLYLTAESNVSQHPATADFDTNGNLTVTTFAKGDGLLPGKYRIAVFCWEVPPSMGSPKAAKSYVPVRYGSAASSGLTVNVEPGQRSVQLNLDVPKK